MKKNELTYLHSLKYRCPVCKQYVLQADYLFSHRRSVKGGWTIVEHCRKCKELGF